MNAQNRYDKDYADYLATLWDTTIKYPITRDLLKKLKVLSPYYVNKPLSVMQSAPVAVTGNVEQVIISNSNQN